MIFFEKGNLFNKYDEVEAIVNTVNCVGVMGKGIALEFKKRFPENFLRYKEKCTSKELTIGKSFIYQLPTSNQTKFIINFPTKKHWRHPSKLEYIEAGLDNLIDILSDYDIKSIAIPALGCGNGNLDWDVVKPLIIKKFENHSDIKVIIFEPSILNGNKKTSFADKTKTKPRLTKDRKKLLLLMNDYNTNTQGQLLTYVQVHIISYFLYHKNPKMKFELRHNGPFLKEINNLILLLSEFYLEPIENSGFGIPKQINILNIDFPQKKEIISDRDYLLVKSLIGGFESYSGLLTLFVSHWLKFNDKVEINSLDIETISWLKNNNHTPNAHLIEKAINRIEKIYSHSENLTLDL